MSQALAPLWKLDADLMALLDSFDTCPDELKPELEQRIAVLVGQEVQKVDAVAAVLANFDQVQAGAEAEIQRLEARKATAKRAQERLEAYVIRVLESRPTGTLEGKTATFKLRRAESLVITDEQAIPAEYRQQKISWEIPKDPIKKAIRAGKYVPGAALRTKAHLVRK